MVFLRGFRFGVFLCDLFEVIFSRSTEFPKFYVGLEDASGEVDFGGLMPYKAA